MSDTNEKSFMRWHNTEPKADEIEEFTQERLAYLYNLEPTQDNMFICSVIGPSVDGKGDADVSTDKWNARKFYSAPFRLHAADFNLPQITFERCDRLRKYFPKKVVMQSQFTLTWIEDCFHSVRKYHHDWFNCWYQREHDYWSVSDLNEHGINGRFRSFKIYMYHVTPNAKDEPPAPQVWGYIDVKQAFPLNLGDIKLGSDTGNSLYTCTYSANYVDLRFVKNKGNDILFGGGNPDEVLPLMGIDENEIKRLRAQFDLRNPNGGESFLS